MENPENVIFVCSECSENMYPNKGTFDVNVGDFAKLKFTDSFGNEYMWVEVEKVDKENNKYSGSLSNDPFIVRYVKDGDNVSFGKEDILDKISKT